MWTWKIFMHIYTQKQEEKGHKRIEKEQNLWPTLTFISR